MEKAGKNRNKGKDFRQSTIRKPVLTDHPLTPEQAKELTQNDPFNLLYKLGPICEMLLYKDSRDGDDEDSRTPMAILISGGWGTGKTSAMNCLEGLLTNGTDKAAKGNVKIRPVWFYPWKYDNKEDVWRGLIAEVILAAMNRNGLDKKTILEGIKIAAAFYGKSILDLASGVDIEIPVLRTKVSGSAIKKIRKNYQEALHPEKPYLQEYENALKKWVKKSLDNDDRLVIFIDDLDRCMPEIALQVFEALKLYLNIEKLVFVVGVDKEVVEKLVLKHYENLGLIESKDMAVDEDEKKQREHYIAKAKQYLSKMFQLEVELSPTEDQIREFFDKHLPSIPYPKNTLNERKVLFRRVILRLASRNPRELKRNFNGALMAAAGVKFIKHKKNEPNFTFEQGLQSFFVRRIVQTQFPSLADMPDTNKGRNFFVEWSRLLIELSNKQQGPDRQGRSAETED